MADKSKNIKPVGGYILVQPTKEEEKTASGLIIQSAGKGERPQKGTVVALGTGLINEKGDKVAFNVKKGDEILFKKYSPEEVELEGETYLLMKEADILAILAD